MNSYIPTLVNAHSPTDIFITSLTQLEPLKVELQYRIHHKVSQLGFVVRGRVCLLTGSYARLRVRCSSQCPLPRPLSVLLRVLEDSLRVLISVPTAPFASLTSAETALTTAPIKQRPINRSSAYLPCTALSARAVPTASGLGCISSVHPTVSTVYTVSTVGCVPIQPLPSSLHPPPPLPAKIS